MISRKNRNLLLVLVLVLIAGMIGVQHFADPMYLRMAESAKPISDEKNAADSQDLMVRLPGQFVVASFAGFREVIAGALWVRADSFFHSGNFKAIIPLVRLVTWFDPHNLDVYTTGAWHLDYNFVDNANSVSDKRYIPASIALLKEGIKNNPDVWDLYFELGWSHYYKKCNDYDNALKYIEEACKHDGIDSNTGQPMERHEFVDRMLAHFYEKMGMYDKALAQWDAARVRTKEMIKKSQARKLHHVVDDAILDVCDKNKMMLCLRLGWRFGDMERYGEGVEIAKRLADRQFPVVLPWAAKGAEENYKKCLAAGTPPHDAAAPLNVSLDFKVTKIKPRVLGIKGTLNVIPSSEYKGLASECFTRWYGDNVERANADNKKLWRDGSRVMWRLEDADSEGLVIPDTFNWQVDDTRTLQWHSFYVSGGTFSDKIDMSYPDDIEMYPLKAERYKLTLWYSVHDYSSPDYVQDRIGWTGDCVTSPQLDKTMEPGFAVVKKVVYLDRSDIL
ncbi:MAG: tetratricopeptide repeat protein [Abditibacteriota bacterium]|nr:tetratricopeptide repeat protein [Abditibacteriota bacterium]